jgi:cell division protein FtsB
MTEPQKRRLMIVAIIGIPIVSYALFSSRGLFARVSLEWERRSLAGKITAARAEQDSLKSQILRLEQDSLLIEKIAREKYGMMKPGEKIFIVDESSTTPK